MTEGQFWKELRAQVNHRAQDEDGPTFPGRCDWLDPKSYSSRGASARITGRALFLKGGQTIRWRYTVVVNRAIRSFEGFDWAEIQDVLPQYDESGWLSVEAERMTIELPPPDR